MADTNSKTVLRIWNLESGIWSLIVLLVAFWSVWRWYYLRLSTSSDEFYGILALLAVIGFSFINKNQFSNYKSLIFSTALILIYAITYQFLPPLLRAIIAFTSLTFFISGWRFGKTFHFGIWSLFLLSLPNVASMQFYLGYPMRLIIGEATAFLLKLNGLVVFREGVSLNFGEKLIWIDAPCSGVKMLWTGFFLTALLIMVYRFNLAKSLLAFVIAFGIILVGNIFRATGLFYLEAEILKMPDFAHEGIGVVCFIFTCIGIVAAIQKLRPTTKMVEEKSASIKLNKISIVFLLACLSAFIVPFWGQKSSNIVQNKFAEFPKTLADRQLQQLELTEREKYFLEDFPGEVKRFKDGEREIIIRFVTEATRKLHPSSDCFAAIGYQIKPLPLKIDEKESRWACFSAKKGEDNLKVCERIYTDSGDSWTDVSSWYWSALSDVNPNVYWAITVAENQSE